MATEHQTNAASAAKEAEESAPAFDQTAAVDFFVKTITKLVVDPLPEEEKKYINKEKLNETYNKIGTAIVKTIHTYIAPLIYAANKHRHPVDVLGTGTELIESEPSDLQFPLE